MLSESKSSTAAIRDLALLFIGKIGSILVGVFFLPIYHSQLGNEAFGVVAVILSIQAFALMADFGMATLVGRDIASQSLPSKASYVLIRQVESLLCAIYALIFICTLTYSISTTTSSENTLVNVSCVIFFLLVVLQNISQVSLIAQKHYVLASLIQVVGITFRAVATALVLHIAQGGIIVFVWIQITTTLLHLLVTRKFCYHYLPGHDVKRAENFTYESVGSLIRRASPIFFSGLAGAAVLQLDKPILAIYITPGDISPYFLAMSISGLPVAILAGPVVQYFQPLIIKSIALHNQKVPIQLIKNFTLALIFLVAVPSWILWQWAEIFVGLWLKDSTQSALVANYLRILLPGFSLGALCYVPVVLLISVQDFKYQAVTSVAMTAITLVLVFYFASLRRVDLVCYAYVFYFLLASTSVWLRSIKLQSVRQLAKTSASETWIPVFVLAILFLFSFYQSNINP